LIKLIRKFNKIVIQYTFKQLIYKNMSTSNLLNEEIIYEALKDVYDPEIPVNIVDLGLVYGVEIKDNDVKVNMTLTFAGCGMGPYIAQQAEWRIAEIEEVDDVEVDLIFEPPWNPDMISEDGKKELGID
tara:strand:+ start:650 stop:1036 length:387 start_codon:yes stop_codon:yes gene_type:complete